MGAALGLRGGECRRNTLVLAVQVCLRSVEAMTTTPHPALVVAALVAGAGGSSCRTPRCTGVSPPTPRRRRCERRPRIGSQPTCDLPMDGGHWTAVAWECRPVVAVARCSRAWHPTCRMVGFDCGGQCSRRHGVDHCFAFAFAGGVAWVLGWRPKSKTDTKQRASRLAGCFPHQFL